MFNYGNEITYLIIFLISFVFNIIFCLRIIELMNILEKNNICEATPGNNTSDYY